MSDLRPRDPVRRSVLGVEIDALTLAETVDRCEELIASGGSHHQISINAAKVVKLRDDAQLRTVCERAALATADGMSIVWASRLLGQRLPERVPGIDLMAALLARAETASLSVYFLGGRREVVARTVEVEQERHPGLRVAGCRDGYWAREEEEDVVASIAACRPDILFVALPTPRKETFVDEHLAALDCRIVVGVGGSFDVVAGVVPRAPAWLQRSGLEWFHRLVREPRKMWKRYLVGNTRFIVMLVAAMARRRRSR